jgi:hypothetical protein
MGRFALLTTLCIVAPLGACTGSPTAAFPVERSDAGTANVGQLPKIQSLEPWTTLISAYADTREVIAALCYEPTTESVWLYDDTLGCSADHKETFTLHDYLSFVKAYPEYQYFVMLSPYFPPGTFSDRTLDGTTVVYDPALTFPPGAYLPSLALNLHAPRTQELIVEAYRAFIARFKPLPHVVGYQIGYSLYQENLTGDFGFTAEALNRFRAEWEANMASESKLDATTLEAVNQLVAALDVASQPTWPLPVEVPNHISIEDTPDNRAHRFYYAYFQKFRQKDIAAFQQLLFDTVKEEAGTSAWVAMFNSQLYTNLALPTRIHGQGFIQLGELPMLPVLDPTVPTMYSLGKDEGMNLQGYGIARCTSAFCEAKPTHPPYGTCLSTRGDTCVCEPVENGCVDDWRVDRTIAYLRRDRAHGVLHRVEEEYVRSGFSVVADGTDWAKDDSQRADDFALLDYMVFNDYARQGEPSFTAQLDDSFPVQVRLYYPEWTLGAVPRLWGAIPYSPGRADVDYLNNLLESRGVKFQAINEDWTGVDTPVIVPYFDFIEPLLAEISGFDAAKVIPVSTFQVAAPSPVDDAFADSMLAAIEAKTGPLRMPIVKNPLERDDPTNDWEPHWVLRAGGYNNVVYNLSPVARCIGIAEDRTLLLTPFEVRIPNATSDDHCTP